MRERDKDRNPKDRLAIKPTDRQKIEREEGERERVGRERKREQRRMRDRV